MIEDALKALADISEGLENIKYCNLCGTETYKLMIHPDFPLSVCEECFDAAYSRAEAKSEPESAPVDEPKEKDEPEDKEPDPVAKADIFKSDKPKQIVYGVTYPMFDDDKFDSQNDRMTEDEIEKMAHKYMIDSQNYDIQHSIFNIPREHARVVESYIAPVDMVLEINGKEKTIRKGSWVMATKLSDELWKLAESGKLNAYSIYGKGKRTLVT